MITIATLFWNANQHSLSFSRGYSETDVERLYHGFARNLTVPFRFVCFSERQRCYNAPIEHMQLSDPEPGYGSCIEPYKLDEPMILVGLDTVIVGNCDHLAAYAIGADKIAVPRDPFFPQKVCNGVALVPQGNARIWTEFPGGNDMEWIRQQDVAVIDDIFPGQVVSYKGEVAKNGLTEDTRIVFFHGHPKARDLPHVGWIARHWHDLECAA